VVVRGMNHAQRSGGRGLIAERRIVVESPSDVRIASALSGHHRHGDDSFTAAQQHPSVGDGGPR